MSDQKVENKYALSNEEKMPTFNEVVRPLIKFLNDYYDPHTKVIVETDGAEIVSGEMSIRTNDFIKD